MYIDDAASKYINDILSQDIAVSIHNRNLTLTGIFYKIEDAVTSIFDSLFEIQSIRTQEENIHD